MPRKPRAGADQDAPAGALPGEKLQKVLARAGLGSRREMERWIEEGRVSVGGRTASLGDRVEGDARIAVDGRPLKVEPGAQTRCILYHKPVGEVCSRSDPQGRRTVFESLPKLKAGRWVSIGRLDYNTSGLLLFTTDGELANRLMHPSSNIEREYLVRVMGEWDEDTLQRLRDGVMLEDGMARFAAVRDGGGEGVNHWFYVVIMEGRNREVRRLWESQGLTVSRLKRVRYGDVLIPSKVRQGNWIELEPAAVKSLYQQAGLAVKAVRPPTRRDKEQAERRLNKRKRLAGASAKRKS